MDCKLFHKLHDEQIKLANDLSWFDSDALDGLGDEIEKILVQAKEVDEERHSAIASAVTERCNRTGRLAGRQKIAISCRRSPDIF